MPAKETYLIRGPDGRMHSQIAHSPRGAVKLWVETTRPQRGGEVAVKARGRGDWEHFRIS